MDISARLGASGIILAHNHPRGIAKPSDADIITTASMEAVADTMGVKLIGHYVIAGFDHALCPGSKK
jgi:DNA repair protein RadC